MTDRQKTTVWQLVHSILDRLTNFDQQERDYLPDDLRRYLAGHDYFSSTHMLKLHARADWTGAPLELRQFYGKFHHRLQKYKIPVYAHTCWRSPDLQRQLYNDGFSKVLTGAHQRSAAVDIVHAHFHWDCSSLFWETIANIGKEVIYQHGYPIVWGGDWKSFKDVAHWEIEGWNDLDPIPNHYPPLNLTPTSMRKAL